MTKKWNPTRENKHLFNGVSLFWLWMTLRHSFTPGLLNFISIVEITVNLDLTLFRENMLNWERKSQLSLPETMLLSQLASYFCWHLVLLCAFCIPEFIVTSQLSLSGSHVPKSSLQWPPTQSNLPTLFFLFFPSFPMIILRNCRWDAYFAWALLGKLGYKSVGLYLRDRSYQVSVSILHHSP